MNRVDELVEVSSRQVGPADASGEERVPRHHNFERRKVQADGALRMTRRVEDLCWIAIQPHLPAVRQRFVRRCGFRRLNAEPGRLLRHHREQRQIALVEVDGRAGQRLELERAADVVNVPMGNKDLLQFEPEVDSRRWMRPISSPGSIMIASRVSSSPESCSCIAAGRQERSRES